MSDDQGVSEAFASVVELAAALDVKNIGQLPGCWEHQVSPQWRIAVNGAKEARQSSTGTAVKPFHCHIEYNGWPAGVMNPYGGIIAAGKGANEATFIAAVKAAIEAAQP